MKFKPNPAKDQNLLENHEIIEREVEEAELDEKDKIVEIGAGTGALTEELCKKAGKVLAFEIDEQFEEILDELRDKHKNLDVIYDNALNYSWEGYNKIVSNIPYSLSEPIILKSINSGTDLLVLVVGEKFKEILEFDSKLGIAAKLFFNIKSIEKVGRENFSPKPRVDSWLVKLERKKKVSKIDLVIGNILMSDMKIKNAIMHELVDTGMTKRQAKAEIDKMGIDKNILNKPCKKITGKFIQLLKEKIKFL